MILCIDIGNTATKIGVVEDDRVVACERVPTHAQRGDPATDRAVEFVVQQSGEPERVAMSSVVPIRPIG